MLHGKTKWTVTNMVRENQNDFWVLPIRIGGYHYEFMVLSIYVSKYIHKYGYGYMCTHTHVRI